MTDIVIIGYGGHASSVVDSLSRTKKFRIMGYTDESEKACEHTYLGTDDVLQEVFNSGVKSAAIGLGFIGKSDRRDEIVSILKSIGFQMPIILDPAAVVAEDALIGEGTFIGKSAVINAKAKVGDHCIINTGSIVEHGCEVGDYSHIAVGSVVCGDSIVSDHVFVGANATIVQGVKIGANSIIGAGSVVLSDVPENSVVTGIIKVRT